MIPSHARYLEILDLAFGNLAMCMMTILPPIVQDGNPDIPVRIIYELKQWPSEVTLFRLQYLNVPLVL